MGEGHGNSTDEELMAAYIDGDHEAFRELFRRYLPALLSLTRRRLASEEEARELVQQTFFQLHVARADFHRNARLRPWLFTIALNLVRQHHRRRTRRKEQPLSETGTARLPTELPGPAPLEREQDVAGVHRALAALPRTQREVVELHWLQGLPFAEVAAAVGASEGAVRVRAHRAYARLRELLGEEVGN